MRFDIRAELPGEELWDFRVAAELRDDGAGRKTPAFHVARSVAGETIRERTGETASLEWRGMVVFVNRSVPLDRAEGH